MNYLTKLHNRHEPHGLEWKILKRLPRVLLFGTLAFVLVPVLSRLFVSGLEAEEMNRLISMVDIYAIALGITLWTAVFTVAIGCIVVVLMKGPGYVADAYDLIDSSTPAKKTNTGNFNRDTNDL